MVYTDDTSQSGGVQDAIRPPAKQRPTAAVSKTQPNPRTRIERHACFQRALYEPQRAQDVRAIGWSIPRIHSGHLEADQSWLSAGAGLRASIMGRRKTPRDGRHAQPAPASVPRLGCVARSDARWQDGACASAGLDEYRA